MKSYMVVAPHADDETLGCGGTLLKLKEKNVKMAWLLVTSPSVESGFSKEFIRRRTFDLEKVGKSFNFSKIFTLDIPPGKLIETHRNLLIESIAEKVASFKPETIFIPFAEDVHSDHRVVFEACQSVLKTFRAPQVKRILCYETLSETDQTLGASFKPNVFENISNYLEEKIKVMNLYSSEIDSFPFPRSSEAIEALARFRGTTSGYNAAEAFVLLRERIS